MKVFPDYTRSAQYNGWTVNAAQSGLWAMSVTDGGGSLTVDAPQTTPVFVRLSDGTNAITTLPVSGSFYQATQPVSGTFWQTTQPVSLASVPSHAVTNSGTFSVQVTSAPSTAVTGTFWQATQPVSLTNFTKCDTDNVTLVDASARPGWSKSNLVGAATTTVKSGAGVLHAIIINRSALSGTITIYDNTAASGTKIATISYGVLTLLTDPPISAQYDASFSTGLTIVTVGANLDVTVIYR